MDQPCPRTISGCGTGVVVLALAVGIIRYDHARATHYRSKLYRQITSTNLIFIPIYHHYYTRLRTRFSGPTPEPRAQTSGGRKNRSRYNNITVDLIIMSLLLLLLLSLHRIRLSRVCTVYVRDSNARIRYTTARRTLMYARA